MGKFKTGDLVKLKSGGPKMTIGEYSSTFIGDIPQGYAVRCYWFDARNEIKQEYFNEAMLEEESSDITGMLIL